MGKATTKPVAKKLSDLQMEEISGVNHPAHLQEGWLVMKSTTGSSDLPDEIADILQSINKGEDMGKEPKDIESAQARIEELESQLARYVKPDEYSTTEDGDESKDDSTRAAQQQAQETELAAAKDRIAELEAQVEAAKGNADEGDVKKSLILKSLPAPLRDYFLEVDAKAETALEELQKARDEAADREYIEKARGWSHLTISPNTIGPALRRLGDENPGLAAEIERVLAAADSVAKSAGVTKEVGGWASVDDESALARLNSLSNDLVQKSASPITFADAFDQVISTPAGKKLYDEYNADKKRTIAMGGN